jgi:hypothetical protein
MCIGHVRYILQVNCLDLAMGKMGTNEDIATSEYLQTWNATGNSCNGGTEFW